MLYIHYVEVTILLATRQEIKQTTLEIKVKWCYVKNAKMMNQLFPTILLQHLNRLTSINYKEPHIIHFATLHHYK